jgi:hypothetical protein
VGGELAEATSDPPDFLIGHVRHCSQISPLRRVPPLEAQEQTELENLEQIGQVLRLLAAQQLPEVLKEDFATHVAAEDFFLERPARPGGEHRLR